MANGFAVFIISLTREATCLRSLISAKKILTMPLTNPF
jgi:hypothetical protein